MRSPVSPLASPAPFTLKGRATTETGRSCPQRANVTQRAGARELTGPRFTLKGHATTETGRLSPQRANVSPVTGALAAAAGNGATERSKARSVSSTNDLRHKMQTGRHQ